MTYPPQQPDPYQQQPNGGYGPPQQWQQWPQQQPGSFPQQYQGGGFPPQQPGGFPQQPGGGFPQPPKPRRGLAIGIVVALVVVLGGGTGAYFLFFNGGNDKAQPAPATSTKPKASPENATSLGTLSTLDPCSLVDTKGFDGTAQAFPYGFTACFVFATKNDVTTDVTVDFSTTWDLSKVDHGKYSVKQQGGATVVTPTDRSSTSACYNDVFFTNTNVILVNAKPDSQNADGGASEDSATLCTEADDATKSVADAINNHTATHLRLGSSSMAGFDACSALNEQTVRQTIGGPGTKQSYPGGHDCFWGDWNDNSQPSVLFSTSLYTDPQKPTDVPGETAQVIAAHPTVLVPQGADSTGTLYTCRADTPEHTWQSWPGKMTPTDNGSSQIIEYASMRVTAKGSQQAACQAAASFAAQTWPHLPQPN